MNNALGKNIQDDSDMKNGHLFDESEEETTLSTPTKSKGILKGWKNTLEDKNLNDGKDTDQCQSSTLASHLRKDSIALTSEKLGQILDIQKHYKKLHKQKRFGKQREILKKYQLQIGVAALFVMTVVIVSIGWHFHAIHKHERMISQRIFFEAEKRNLNLADPAKRDDIAGKLGLSLPIWQLPSHCNKETEEDEYQCLKWKGNAEFRIWYYTRDAIQCYNISWYFLNTHMLPKDCYQIGNAAWYGPSNVSNPTWTNHGINFTFSSSFTHQFDAGDYSLATENYWLSSRGVGIYVPGNIPLIVDWNKSKRGWICLISNYTGDFYGNKLTHAKHFLNYTICNGNDIKATHAYMRNLLPSPPIQLPDPSLFSDPLWSTADEENDEAKTTDKSIFQKVLLMRKHNLTCSSLVFDRTWQKLYGDFEFDPE
ncbi:hypothetical protein FSP39_006866 [Pinctada imbricata]|uniref:Uncharacterized protein n=1 Tax=Pinctada imbricata TaxID=66713 RepID=A0AA89C5G4_PINIB|nr:hypothetical protein FSP39_006866 [Pinctada imbricata]